MQTSMSISQKQLQSIRRGGSRPHPGQNRELGEPHLWHRQASFSARFSPPQGSSLSRSGWGHPTHHNFIWPRGQSRHLPQSVSTSWGWFFFFFFPSDYGMRGFHPIKGKAFPTSHHRRMPTVPAWTPVWGQRLPHSQHTVKQWFLNHEPGTPWSVRASIYFLKGPKKTPPVVSKGEGGFCILQ